MDFLSAGTKKSGLCSREVAVSGGSMTSDNFSCRHEKPFSSQGFDCTTEIGVGSSRLIESTLAFNKVVAYPLL